VPSRQRLPILPPCAPAPYSLLKRVLKHVSVVLVMDGHCCAAPWRRLGGNPAGAGGSRGDAVRPAACHPVGGGKCAGGAWERGGLVARLPVRVCVEGRGGGACVWTGVCMTKMPVCVWWRTTHQHCLPWASKGWSILLHPAAGSGCGITWQDFCLASLLPCAGQLDARPAPLPRRGLRVGAGRRGSGPAPAAGTSCAALSVATQHSCSYFWNGCSGGVPPLRSRVRGRRRRLCTCSVCWARPFL
jgi:hypothetical protein